MEVVVVVDAVVVVDVAVDVTGTAIGVPTTAGGLELWMYQIAPTMRRAAIPSETFFFVTFIRFVF